jgi:DNA invertase Pin-like site-specific DNA recombinase
VFETSGQENTVKDTQPNDGEGPSGPLRPAAQYVRMSDAQQMYSIETQKEMIAEYARREGYELVATYADEAKSGVSLRGRDGLKSLLRDVHAGAPFEAVLVTDVTRWGRFQDPDEGAHYEFICRKAGVSVVYCAEVFDNSGGQASAILKSVKRVMAAEYSRQLSARTRAAVFRVFAEGQCPGGPAPYGFAKELLDPLSGQVRILGPGQRKQRASERLRFAWGPAEEVANVRRIFRDYARDGRGRLEIARALNCEGRAYSDGQPWTSGRVTAVLDNDLAIGLFAFGKSTNRFGVRTKVMDRKDWSRVRVVKPVVSRALFAKARARRDACVRRVHSDETLIQDLRRLIARHGPVTHQLIAARGIAPPSVYVRRFGSVGTALKQAGQISTVRSGVKWEADDLTWTRVEAILKRLLDEHGYLSRTLINACPYAPRATTLVRYFGPLTGIYLRVGDETTTAEKASRALEAAARRYASADDPACLASHLRTPRVGPAPKATGPVFSGMDPAWWPMTAGPARGR